MRGLEVRKMSTYKFRRKEVHTDWGNLLPCTLEERVRRLSRTGLLLLLLLLCIAVRSTTPRSWASSRAGPSLSARTGSAPLKARQVPLTQALKMLAVNLERDYILFGGEVYRDEGKEPLVDVDIPPYSDAEEGLRRIFAQLPPYTFAVLSQHLVSVYPKKAIDDPTDPLNLKIRSFDVEGQRAGLILTWPERFIPELKARTSSSASEDEKTHHIDIYVGSVAGGPTVTLHLKDVTVRQILNAVSEATEKSVPREEPMGWVYSPAARSPSGKGEVEYWRLFMTLPHNWLEQARGRGQNLP